MSCRPSQYCFEIEIYFLFTIFYHKNLFQTFFGNYLSDNTKHKKV